MIQKLSFFLFLVFQKLNEQAEKINDMIGVMQSAIKKDDSFVQNEAELFSRLKTENQVKCIFYVIEFKCSILYSDLFRD